MQGRAAHVAIIAGMTVIAIALLAIMASWVIDSGVGRALVDGSPVFSAATPNELVEREDPPAPPSEDQSPPRTYR